MYYVSTRRHNAHQLVTIRKVEDIAEESPIDYDNDSDSSSESNESSCDADAETETENEFQLLPLDNKKLKIPPKKWLTDEGYSVVYNKKTGHQSTDLKTASSSRVYVNSGHQLRTSQKYTLRIRIGINLFRKI